MPSSNPSNVREPRMETDDIKWQLNLNVLNVNKRRNLINKLWKTYLIFSVVLIMMLIITVLILLIVHIIMMKDMEEMHSLKTEVKFLRLKYEYDLQQNNFRLRRLAHSDLVGPDDPFEHESSDSTEEEEVNSESESDRVVVTKPTTNVYPNQVTSPLVLDHSMDRGNDTHEETDGTVSNDTTTSLTACKDNSVVDPVKQNLPSYNDTGTDEMQNRTARDTMTDANDSASWSESRERRLRRDEGRGKERRKNRRKLNRSRRRLGPQVATFIGAIPEQHITNSVVIGPWIKSEGGNQYDLIKFHLVEKNMAIEINTNGLYLISVQIFYFGEAARYSYWLLLNSEGLSKSRKLVKCAAATSNVAADVSCYTSIVMHMQRGDRLYIEQQELNRFINLREGYSHIQLVLLANDTQKRRST